ncbi:MAG: hypothetical protein U0457_17725 [Candidatus Sericytochromatia bacterium]
MKKIITKCNKIVYFGIQTKKGNTYFGDDISKLTPFILQKSSEIVSIDGKIVLIKSVEKDKNIFHLENGKSLLIKTEIDSNGSTKKIGIFK